jgi:hypothetical protein
MNRYAELKRKETHIAVLGLNTEGIRYALDFSSRFSTMIHDKVVPSTINLNEFLESRGLEVNLDKHKLILANQAGDLRAAGIFYLNGLSNSMLDWGSVKDAASLIGKSLNAGDWVIFGPHIDPDLAEVVLLEVIQKNSGLRLGNGFEIAFHPAVIGQHNFDRMGNEMKMSHNLIVNQVEEILNIKKVNEFDSNQINYQNLDNELKRIKGKIQELWIPMLNDMTRETFQEFVELSINKKFLDAYTHLRLSTETHVNWKRFFDLVLQFGIKSELEGVLEQRLLKKAV